MPSLRDYDFSEVKPWAGLRPCTPDGLPYIGRVKTLNNLQVGTGHAMLGWTLGPITGKMLAEEILGEEVSVKSKLRCKKDSIDHVRSLSAHQQKQIFKLPKDGLKSRP